MLLAAAARRLERRDRERAARAGQCEAGVPVRWLAATSVRKPLVREERGAGALVSTGTTKTSESQAHSPCGPWPVSLPLPREMEEEARWKVGAGVGVASHGSGGHVAPREEEATWRAGAGVGVASCRSGGDAVLGRSKRGRMEHCAERGKGAAAPACHVWNG
jgi:hypothetical protein